ncbi:nucleotide disphospho-sugar-binding domain-containing protein [Streptosporangium sp. NPDC002544]|uniref:nucleotide disphospho-sugar-binding domain-containing protein n=1 Tax=Streptosporangium sp. NPDC002544 TaxID=3154538 RepID=UPI00331EF73D
MRLLFTTAPLRGHFFPLVPLAWAARAAGHDVLVATTDGFAAVVVRSGLPAASFGSATDFVELVGDEPAASAADAERRRHAHGRAFGRISGQCLPGARELVKAWRPDLVVSERAEFAGPLAAAAAGVPYVEYQWGVAPLAEYRSAVRGELGIEPPVPVEVLNPWPPGMRLPHAAGHQSVRNVPYTGDARVPGWVFPERRRPRVCVTLGTVVPRIGARLLGDLVVPVLERLARHGAELVVAADEEVVAAWPALAATAHRVGRLPLAQVLPTCDLVVNHGGHGTVLTALSAGRPQLVLPQFDDQFDNAGAVVGAGAGMWLPPEEATPELVAERCLALLADARFTVAAADVAAEIAAQPAPVDVVYLLEKLAV